MRYLFLLVGFLSVNLLATETIQDDPCKTQDCTQQQPQGGPTQEVTLPKSTTITEPSSNLQAETVTDGNRMVLKPDHAVIINVVGQGVAPTNTTSPAQAYALAKRAAIADAYRLIAEKVKGVEIEGQDLIKNMMVQRSTVRTAVYAMVRQANIVETNFRDGLCEVEMEIKLSYDSLAR